MAYATQPDPAKSATVAQQIVKVLAKEDSATRQRAISAALTLLGEQAPRGGGHSKGESAADDGGDAHADMASFFERDGKLKPSDNAFLCAAYHFSLYGTAAFSLDELRDLAREAGVVIPDRVDMTLRQAGKGKKKLFQSAGRDSYKPTAAAGVFFKEKWNVRPGKMPKPKRETE